MAELHDLSPAPGSTKNRKRVGRGPGSGYGKTAGRGQKGQKSRSGGQIAPGFEGGQMPLHRRIPKRGFNNIFRTEYQVVNVRDLEGLEGPVGPEVLYERGLVGHAGRPVKVLGDGELGSALDVSAHAFSRSAREKIEAAGGTATVVDPVTERPEAGGGEGPDAASADGAEEPEAVAAGGREEAEAAVAREDDEPAAEASGADDASEDDADEEGAPEEE